ncbi:MAG: ferritin-like domain-containing protein [Polyangiaceae bacterium]
MAASSATLHEEGLKPTTVDRHRAIVSLMEELEAVDWYDQRVEAATDEELKALLAHNRDEEKEHAVMMIEWLRRNDPGFDENLRTYLFAKGSILEVEESGKEESAGKNDDGGGKAATRDGSLGIGSLKRLNAGGSKGA